MNNQPSSGQQQQQLLPLNSQAEIRIGGKYRLGKKIGAGSFGDIYFGIFLPSILHILNIKSI